MNYKKIDPSYEVCDDMIRISKVAKLELKELKVHPREPYSSVIMRLIKEVKENESN